jgi:hypothetical protein
MFNGLIRDRPGIIIMGLLICGEFLAMGLSLMCRLMIEPNAVVVSSDVDDSFIDSVIILKASFWI